VLSRAGFFVARNLKTKRRVIASCARYSFWRAARDQGLISAL
jgi:hypothetical protein